MTTVRPSASAQADGDATHRHHRLRTAIVIVVVLIGLPLQLFTGCSAVIGVMSEVAVHRLADRAAVLVAGTPWDDVPVDQLPGYGTSGNLLCLDNCLYLSFDVPAPYVATVADNVARAGWSVDIPGCLTTPDGDVPPCSLLDEEGNDIGLASYWPGPNLFIMLGPG